MKPAVFILGIAVLAMPMAAFASVVINEIAWMGTINLANDEWIELYNNGDSDINLEGWILIAADGTPNINFSNATNKIIPAGDFFLLERTDDTSVPDIPADLIYTGALLDSGENLIIKDNNGNVINAVDASGGWPAGDKITRQTMQWNGAIWITATATPKAANANASSQSSQQESSSSSEQQSQETDANLDNSKYIQPEKLPKIKAYAGEDKIVFIGASAEFRGQAFGLDNKPLPNARYLWTFGDGASKEGQNVAYDYKHPGQYIAVLNISSGEYAAADYMLVKAIPNQVFISEVKPGNEGWVELENKSDREIDISGYQLKSASQIFTFPQNSHMLSAAYLVVPSEVSKINFPENSGVIELFYDGGTRADLFSYSGTLTSGQSFNRNDKNIVIAQETPGMKNAILLAKENLTPQNPPVNQNLKSSNADTKITENNNELSQEANISASEKPATKSNTKIYLLAILGLIIFSSAAVLFVRHRNDSEKNFE